MAGALALRDGDRERLQALARSSNLAQRALIVLLAADGMANTEIARLAKTSRPTVIKWRQRYETHGLPGLDDGPRSGRPATIDEVDVLGETLADGGKPPARLGVTHWSARLMADRLGISFASVARIWRKYDIRPQSIHAFRFGTDPEVEVEFHEVVGLYLSPLVRAVAVSVDMETPAPPVDCDRSPEQPVHDCIRSSGDALFTALEIAVGKNTVRDCRPHENYAEFIDFLETVATAHPKVRLRVICDDNAPQSHAEVRAWRDDHPRVSVHRTRRDSSWLTVVGICLGIATRQAIRRGVYVLVDDIEVALRAYIDAGDGRADANSFTWSKNAEQGLGILNRKTINNTPSDNR
ncbi:IS630 family transposase [Mycobacterium sp.]|uniref:IS630 family transposase n=1 Tax=Mycobacterium sp. TaxID=1785 RepID=UPI002CECE91B|nr:IS630 family transposase [Mycobacterium sp.]HKP40627.1 IS630 family transposase [Mycobacterium sp.]